MTEFHCWTVIRYHSYETNLKIFVMKKGKMTETMDQLFSPRIPTIEDQNNLTRD